MTSSPVEGLEYLPGGAQMLWGLPLSPSDGLPGAAILTPLTSVSSWPGRSSMMICWPDSRWRSHEELGAAT